MIEMAPEQKQVLTCWNCGKELKAHCKDCNVEYDIELADLKHSAELAKIIHKMSEFYSELPDRELDKHGRLKSVGLTYIDGRIMSIAQKSAKQKEMK